MKSASVTDLENNLGGYLELVRNGESLLITERGVAVARIEPVPARLGGGQIPKWLIEKTPVKLKVEVSVVQALLDERDSSDR